MRWAVINLENNIVENVIIWDGQSFLPIYDAKQLIQLQENENCQIGLSYRADATPRFFDVEQN